jgi:hypothetical protein
MPGRTVHFHAGILSVSDLDYDVPSVPKVVVVAPAATRDAAAGWGSPHSPWTRGSRGQQSQSHTRPAPAGDHCSRSGIDTYDGSFAGEEKVSRAPDGLCSM